jgi:hypothetical protein
MLDYIELSTHIILIATTNKAISEFDDCFIRKGRFNCIKVVTDTEKKEIEDVRTFNDELYHNSLIELKNEKAISEESTKTESLTQRKGWFSSWW